LTDLHQLTSVTQAHHRCRRSVW